MGRDQGALHMPSEHHWSRVRLGEKNINLLFEGYEVEKGKMCNKMALLPPKSL